MTIYKLNPQGCCNTALYVKTYNDEQRAVLEDYCLEQQNNNPNGSYGVTTDKVDNLNVLGFDEWRILRAWG